MVAALLGGGSRRVAGRFLPAVRAQLVVLYFSAAFWKLTTSWFDPHYSCAPVLMSELLAGLQPYVPLPDEASAALLLASPAMVAGLEFCVPALLLLRPRWGVLLALVFHQTINLMPTTYAGGFSIAMCARLGALFMPGCFGAVAAWMRGAPPRGAPATARAARPLIPLFLPIGLVAITTGFMVAIHKQLDTAGGAYLAFATLYFIALTLPEAPPAAPSAAVASLPAHASWALPKVSPCPDPDPDPGPYPYPYPNPNPNPTLTLTPRRSSPRCCSPTATTPPCSPACSSSSRGHHGPPSAGRPRRGSPRSRARAAPCTARPGHRSGRRGRFASAP